MPRKKVTSAEDVHKKRKPTIDPQLHKVVDEMRGWMKTLKTSRVQTPGVIETQAKLADWADRLEVTEHAGFEDSYGYCTDLIDPHIKHGHHGMISISHDSLIPSVNESLEYLIEFWVANRDKAGIDSCL